jgi:membrane-associated phospholipid phosphatase
LHDFDVAVFHWVNQWPEALNGFFRVLSEGNKDWTVRLLLAALLGMLLFKRRSRLGAIQAVLAVVVGNLLCDMLKHALQWQRPCVQLSDAIVRYGKLTSFGTASAHACNMAAVAMVFSLSFGKIGASWWLIALLVGLSRVYAGVHYPSQVLLGWLVGATAGFAIVRFWPVEAKKVEPDPA